MELMVAVADEQQGTSERPARMAVPAEPLTWRAFLPPASASRATKREFWKQHHEGVAALKAQQTDEERDKRETMCEAYQATLAMHAAIDALPVAAQAVQRFKFRRALLKGPYLFVFSQCVFSSTGSADDGYVTLHPTQVYLDAIAAVAAGKFDWDIMLAAGLFHPVELRDVMPWLPRWPRNRAEASAPHRSASQ